MAASKDTGVGICCGLLIILAIIGAIIGNWATISKYVLGILWGIIFLILLIGILVEGWKAVKPDVPNKPDPLNKQVEVTSWNDRGSSLFKQGNFESAIWHYNKGLELDPTNLDILYNKALALNKQGKTEEAMKCYETIRNVKENPATENIEKSPKKEGQDSSTQHPVIPLSTPLKDNCRYCGIKLTESSQNFCRGCGKRLTEPTNLSSTFCRKCGAELKYSNAEICHSCGTRVKGPVTPKASHLSLIFAGILVVIILASVLAISQFIIPIIPSAAAETMFHANAEHTGVFDNGGTVPTNTELWRLKTGGMVYSSPAVSNGVVYVGSNDNNLYAIDVVTGKEKWRFNTGGLVSSSPAVSSGIVYVGSLDNNLYAIDAVTGKEKWRFKTGNSMFSSPAVSKGVVYVGSNDNNLYAIDAVTGKEKWRFKTGYGVSSSPAVSNEVVYVGSVDNNLYAIDTLTGKEKWRFTTGDIVISPPAVSNGVAYVGSSDGNLYAIDAVTGKEKWRFKTGGLVSSSPAVSNGVVYVGSSDGNLYVIDAVTGKERWRNKTGGSVSSSPAVSNGVVYVGSEDQNLYAIDAVTGKENWRFTTGGLVSSSPAVSNGVVYVGSYDGNLYAIGGVSSTSITTSPTRAMTTKITPYVPAGSHTAPKIEFSVSSTDGIAPHTVTVYPKFNSAGGAPQYIILDFGDGQQLNDTLKTSYTHTYPAAGSYTITLTSVNAGGSNVETLQSPVIVRNPAIVTGAVPNNPSTGGPGSMQTTTIATPVSTGPGSSQEFKSAFTFSPNGGSAPLIVKFLDKSLGNPIKYEWTFGDSDTYEVSLEANPTHLYDKEGQYTIQQLVYFNNSKMDFSRQTILVTIPVNAQFVDQATGRTTISFRDSSSGKPVKWHWDFGDGTFADTQNPGSHKYSLWGTYQVTLTVWNSEGKSDTFTKSCGTQ